MDISLFREILEIDSTSGNERALSEFLSLRLMRYFASCGAEPCLRRQEVGDGTENLLFVWGKPELVFCTHMDTVPPYIPPVFHEDRVCGRGSNDAKGQAFAMISACAKLLEQGRSNFALLLVSGEETGSYGAKAFAAYDFSAPYLIVGEPTENKMVSASKGTKAFSLEISGKRCHSGYPEYGVSAVEIFHKILNELDAAAFPYDDILGKTSWNVGRLSSDNAQNILSDKLICRIYFRTTFASDALVCAKMNEISSWNYVSLESLGGDEPRKYMTLDAYPSASVSFGSDAPHLTNFEHKAIFGPGNILTAHTENEYVSLPDIEYAVSAYCGMYESLVKAK